MNIEALKQFVDFLLVKESEFQIQNRLAQVGTTSSMVNNRLSHSFSPNWPVRLPLSGEALAQSENSMTPAQREV